MLRDRNVPLEVALLSVGSGAVLGHGPVGGLLVPPPITLAA